MIPDDFGGFLLWKFPANDFLLYQHLVSIRFRYLTNTRTTSEWRDYTSRWVESQETNRPPQGETQDEVLLRPYPWTVRHFQQRR